MGTPELIWDCGTGYDFFLSLEVLHDPYHYGMRPAWSAGMRARLPAEHRETLEIAQLLFQAPSVWVSTLPEPKDTATVLWHLSQIPPEDRLPTLASGYKNSLVQATDMLKRVIKKKRWSAEDLSLLSKTPRQLCDCLTAYSEKEAKITLNAYAQSEVFGEKLLYALRAYQEVFFAEEEKRIQPALDKMVNQAKAMAQSMSVVDLVESLTQGVSMPNILNRSIELVMAPSFWAAPLIQYFEIDANRELLVFGSRPKNMSLIPGEIVPDTLVRSLKTLSDPTRLRILQHLTVKSMTPAQLARHLRLRPPTITHHLRVLRLAGLIRITKDQHFNVKSYAARSEAVSALNERLTSFLKGQNVVADEDDCCQHH